MRGLSARAPVGIKDMMRGDILGKLVVNILKPDHELGNYLMRFLAYVVELPKQFSLRDFTMEKFEELSVDVLERRKVPRVVARIPLSGRSIEGQCKFRDFRSIDVSGNESLCLIVGLPCGYEGTNVRFCVDTIGIPWVWVGHGVEIRVFW